MVKAMDCGIVVSEFELQSRYYFHFRSNTLGKGMNPLILILSDLLDFHMIDNLSIAFHPFAKHMLASLSVDEMLLLRYMNWSIKMKMAPFCLKHVLCFIGIHAKANTF